MLAWLEANVSTILVGAVLLAVVVLAVRKLIRDRREGNSPCGCGGCDGCAACGKCRRQ